MAATAAIARARRTAVTEETPVLRTWDILRFYIPLAATTMFYAVVFNVMNSAMARTIDAAAALAAFAVGQSIADLVAVPAGSGHQWLLARARDKQSFRAGLRVMAQLIGIVLVLLALAGWTPLGRLIYQGIFGAPANLSPGISAVIKICLPLPLIFALRGASQSVLMIRRQTHLMTAGVVVRLGYVSAMAILLGRSHGMSGAVIGGLLWVSGMGVESLVDFALAVRLYRQYPEAPESGVLPSPAGIWRFLLPLIATSLLWSLGKPILNLGMARSADPEGAIAIYQVTWNAAWLLIAYVQGGFRQAVVVFWNDARTLKALQRFAAGLAAAVTVLMAALTLSGGATWFLRDVVGAAEELIGPARGVLLVMSVLPLALVATEVCIGRLLRNGTTGPIGLAKGANLASMAAVVLGLAVLAPNAGALIGALGMLAGVLGEFVVAYIATRRIGTAPAAGDN
ncbi:MAG: hypothetical protein Q8P31_13560 [Bacillota bacterium]|nr:hypothetical protein [Bacillota bacterium]